MFCLFENKVLHTPVVQSTHASSSYGSQPAMLKHRFSGHCATNTIKLRCKGSLRLCFPNKGKRVTVCSFPNDSLTGALWLSEHARIITYPFPWLNCYEWHKPSGSNTKRNLKGRKIAHSSSHSLNIRLNATFPKKLSLMFSASYFGVCAHACACVHALSFSPSFPPSLSLYVWEKEYLWVQTYLCAHTERGKIQEFRKKQYHLNICGGLDEQCTP